MSGCQARLRVTRRHACAVRSACQYDQRDRQHPIAHLRHLEPARSCKGMLIVSQQIGVFVVCLARAIIISGDRLDCTAHTALQALLMKGARTDIANLAGQTALQVALLSASSNACRSRTLISH